MSATGKEPYLPRLSVLCLVVSFDLSLHEWVEIAHSGF